MLRSAEANGMSGSQAIHCWECVCYECGWLWLGAPMFSLSISNHKHTPSTKLSVILQTSAVQAFCVLALLGAEQMMPMGLLSRFQ